MVLLFVRRVISFRWKFFYGKGEKERKKERKMKKERKKDEDKIVRN